jgi:chemosensory pili system protein ChpA (sensor histidine kinase/response regulator)
MVYGRDDLLQKEPPEHIILECLTILSVASTTGGATEETTRLTELKDLFNAHAPLSDTEMQEEGRLMNGPTGTVIQSVVQLIYEELAPLKEAMDQRSRRIIPEWTLEVSIHDLVKQTAHTLNMVGEMESAAVLKEQSLVLEVLSDSTVDIQEEQLQSLADTFVFIEQSLAKLLGSYSVEPEENNENMLSPRSVLEQARHLIFVESRASLGVVKRAVASYVDSHGDGNFLDQVTAHLYSTVGALQFLHLDRAARVLSTALTYIDKYMIEQDQMPSPEVLEVVADVLMSVDYYLESLEDRKSIGEGVLEAAELSVNMLKQAFEQPSPSEELEGTSTQG